VEGVRWKKEEGRGKKEEGRFDAEIQNHGVGSIDHFRE